MVTNKLGLKIVRTSQGYGDGLEVNGGLDWTKNVRDVREDLKYIENLQGDTSVLMLTCVDGGNLLTIASLIDGRVTDCISAWIYIPSDLLISGKNLVEVIEITRDQILAVERNDELLKSKFDKTYEVAPAKRISQRAVGDKYAYRYYGGKGSDYQLWELLDNINQPYYQQYKSVFFIDKSTQLICSTGDDLSTAPLLTSILAHVPKKVDGFIPYINGNVFSSPMYVTKGESIKITWQRSGYEPITTISKVKEGFVYEEPTVNQYKRLIPFESIKVVDEWKQPIKKYSLCINHSVVRPGEFVSISEAALDAVQINVTASGYEPKGGVVNFNQSQTWTIRLSKTTFEYELAIPLIDGSYNYLKLEKFATEHSLDKSPIEGYVPIKGHFSRHDITHMKYAPYNRKFWIKSAIVLFIVLICGVCLGAWVWDEISSTEVNSLKTENRLLNTEIDDLKSKGSRRYEPKKEEPKVSPQDSDISAAIEYLDEKNVWNRTKMEAIPELRGLWDAINERRFEDILEFEDKLKDSERFRRVVVAVRANQSKVFTSNFNTKTSDKDITIDPEPEKNKKGYIKALDDAQKQQPAAGAHNAATPSQTKDAQNNTDQQKIWGGR